jgi:D-serine deaminase-like pyridoxal phosphate-dependent protein
MPVPPLLPDNAADIPSPALVLHWKTVEENLRRMIAAVSSPAHLRPHHKTHKLPQIVSRFAALGVRKAKCATIAEAEMAAAAGADDVLLAAPLVGPSVSRFLELQRAFPGVIFSSLTDNAASLDEVNAAAVAAGVRVNLMLDLEIGQQRTGIPAGPDAEVLYHRMATLPGINPAGLHAYDGHLSQTDVSERTAACESAFAPVALMWENLRAAGLPVPCVVAGGSPTFPMHARRADVECSPGTTTLWDAGYSSKVPDLDFLCAAVLLTRVISRPALHRLCLDLGHKSVASEMPHPRAIFPALPEARAVLHSEEHLVLETDRAAAFPPGTVLAAIPWHICPTVALHSFVHIARGNRVVETWPVTARTRRITC